MAHWRVRDVDAILSAMDMDASPIIGRARILAFIVRRKLGIDLRNVPKRKRRFLVGAKRYANRVARRYIVSAKRGHLAEKVVRKMHKGLLYHQFKPSKLLDGFVPDRSKVWSSLSERIRKREVQAITVDNFSFLQNPTGTANALSKIAMAEASCLAANIDFKDQHCLDIGPWLVLSVMRGDMIPVFVGGAISNGLSKVFSALQLDEAMGMTVAPFWDKEKDIWAFPIRRRRPAGTSTSPSLQLEPQTKEKLGDELCDAIDDWLNACVSQELTGDGRHLVKVIAGETLDNAERHSNHIEHPDDGDWMVSGMMVRRNLNGNNVFLCQLAFLSIGSTIAESMLSCPPMLLEKMERYVALHKKSFPRAKHAAEHLRTVFALQPGVSRDAEAIESKSGGTGFSDIMNLFSDLAAIESADCGARLAIVSGNTCIHIGYPYCRSKELKVGETRQIWFNEENTAKVPPDQDVVISLENGLKGTLVTMSFTLEREYLERTIDAKN